MFYVAGHRMCKTRLKMMVSCARLTRTTQLHRTGHHPDDDDIHEDDCTGHHDHDQNGVREYNDGDDYDDHHDYHAGSQHAAPREASKAQESRLGVSCSLSVI